MTPDEYTVILGQLGTERAELERHISRHKGLGPEYNRAAHKRIGEINALEEKLYAARRAAEGTS